MYEVNVANCNSIINGSISIEPGKLNIKYGINGTGKSTIAKALCNKDNPEELKKLQSYLTTDSASVSVSPTLSKILIFDEDFVGKIVFQDSSVIENAFEVFLKTPNYDQKKQALDNHLKGLHDALSSDPGVIELQELIVKLQGKFSRSKNGNLTKTGTLKSILSKQNIYNVPDELIDYNQFLGNTEIAIPWIDWRNKGDQYDTGDRCPYCSEHVNRPVLDTKKRKFQQTYKKADSQNLKEILELLESLQDYIEAEKYQNLISYIKSDTSEDILMKIIGDMSEEYDIIVKRFMDIREFGYKKIAIADISMIDTQIQNMMFPIDLFSIFGSDSILAIFKRINETLALLKSEVGVLKKEMGALKGLMQATIQKSQQDINEFLRTAGIQYEIEIQSEDEGNSRTILRQCYTDDKNEVTRIPDHLSWGEKNAFALVLFMYYAESQNPDLIILDDPISSFDTNKKYAIMQRMFKNIGKRDISLENKTVLLLTHDFEPITDFIVVGKLDVDHANSCFIWNENGVVRELAINPDEDVKIINRQCSELAMDEENNVISRVAFLRKLCELNECKSEWGNAYEILSCLIHAAPIQRKLANGVYEEMDPLEIECGLELIKRFIPSFEYDEIKDNYYSVAGICSLYTIETVPYFKVQLFRELKELAPDNQLKLSKLDQGWFKFIDETYHIENDNLHYIDMKKFNIVPDYIMRIIEDAMRIIQAE